LAAAAPQAPSTVSISGHVYADETGAPAPGARVTLTEHSFGLRNRVGVSATDEHGAFAFTGFPPGSYTLDVEKTGYLYEQVPVDEPGKEFVVRIRRVAVVSGRVVDSNNEPLDKAVVEVMKKNYTHGEVSLESAGYATTDDRGVYRASGLAPGRYYVRASRDGYDTVLYPATSSLTSAQRFDLTVGADKSEINFRMHRTPRFNLAGRLVDAETNGPARAAFLRAQAADSVTGTFADSSVREGRFQLQGLAPGRYFLRFDWVGPTNNVIRTVIVPFEMGHADQCDVTLTAMPRVTVAGRLKTGAQSLPRNLGLYLQPIASAVGAFAAPSAPANVKEDGTFEITGVEAGQYHLRGSAARFFLEDRDVTVDGRAPVTGVELLLNVPAGTVSGRAVDAEGSPIPNAFVVLQSTDAEKRIADLYRHVYRASSSGDYSIAGVVPGEYLLFAWRGDPGLIGDPDLFTQAGERAQRVTVGRGDTVHRDATEMRDSE